MNTQYAVELVVELGLYIMILSTLLYLISMAIKTPKTASTRRKV